MPLVISDHDLIRNAIARYCLGIDLRDWTVFSEAFTEDAKIYFPAPIGLIEGVPALIEKVQSMVGTLQTQHALSTQIIEITSEETASASTYGRAIHFGIGPDQGRDVTAWGLYQDRLVKGIFNGRESWKIKERKVIFQTPFKGDLSLIPM